MSCAIAIAILALAGLAAALLARRRGFATGRKQGLEDAGALILRRDEERAP